MRRERATKKQQELLQFIREFLAEHDYSPSYREIMRALDYKSVSTVAVHVNGLVAKGFLERRPGSARSLEIAGTPPRGDEKTPVESPDLLSAIQPIIDNFDRSEEQQRAITHLLDATTLLYGEARTAALRKRFEKMKSRVETA